MSHEKSQTLAEYLEDQIPGELGGHPESAEAVAKRILRRYRRAMTTMAWALHDAGVGITDVHEQWFLLWRDGPPDGKETYVLTPLQRGAPQEPGKWVMVGEVKVNDA